MLELDGAQLSFIKKDSNEIGKAVIDAWEEISTRYELDKGKTVQLIYDEKLFKEYVEETDASGRIIGKVRIFPSGISIMMSAKFTDNSGNQHTIEYKPTRNGRKAQALIFNGSHTFSLKDKEQFLFIYCFSGLVSNGLKSKYINTNQNVKQVLILEDLERDAIVKYNDELSNMSSFTKISNMDETKLRRFAIAIGFGAAKTMTVNLLRISVADKVKSDKSLLKILDSFDKAYSEDKFKYEETLNKAIAIGLVSGVVNTFEHKVNWGYLGADGKIETLICQLVGTKKDEAQLLEYLKADDASFAELSNKVNQSYEDKK